MPAVTPGGRPHVPVTDVDGVRVDGEARVLVGQLLGPGPVGRHGATVEQTGLGADERPAADGGDASAALGCATNPADQRLRRNVLSVYPPPPGINSVSIFSRADGRGAVTICSPLSVVIGPPSFDTIETS